MGPRLFSRGNIISCVYFAKHNKLQWGHDSSAVEIDEEKSVISEDRMLQWGHDSSAVEINHVNRNAAKYIMLQWGHDSSAVEISGPFLAVQHTEKKAVFERYVNLMGSSIECLRLHGSNWISEPFRAGPGPPGTT